ncbi:MAG: FkbM family methyltransferase [Verrucomicrobia bacterium]|nr:FkbM family methyltransferase [Verrucomicrobiota bacterium]MBU4292364.1 FkbM family methyltransferase [Verrucomicrobiota bacterium]MBU4429074.1 FkbM family methyltransferase [Verrucomicrobiota bacterium]MCG2680887.1 FkbM family methyltransferase [Kiritimatiellia bacterium]
MRRIKSVFRRLWLRGHGIREEFSCTRLDLGVGRGSWCVCPDALNAQSIVYSVGIGADISFDLALISRFQAVVHAFDPTPRARDWIRTQTVSSRFVYHDYGIAAYDGMLAFHAPKNPGSAHFSPVPRYRGAPLCQVAAPVKTLKTIMAMLGHARLDVLKLDIEGGEYDVIKNILADRLSIRQLLIEFHHNYRTIRFNQTLEALRQLREAGFRIFRISPRGLEFSLVRVG